MVAETFTPRRRQEGGSSKSTCQCPDSPRVSNKALASPGLPCTENNSYEVIEHQQVTWSDVIRKRGARAKSREGGREGGRVLSRGRELVNGQDQAS